MRQKNNKTKHNKYRNMKAVIKESLRLCSNMWNVDSKQVINNRCRKADVIMAKRMFIYYLYNFVEIGHAHIKNHVKGLNHATSIYHVREFNKQLDIDYAIKLKFQRFMEEMKSFSLYGEEFEQKKQELEQIKVELNNLKR